MQPSMGLGVACRSMQQIRKKSVIWYAQKKYEKKGSLVLSISLFKNFFMIMQFMFCIFSVKEK